MDELKHIKDKKFIKKLRKYTISHKEVLKKYTKEERKQIKMEAKYFSLLNCVRVVRSNSDITQVELSRRSGIPRETISKIESGNRNVTIGKLVKLADALGKTLEIRFV